MLLNCKQGCKDVYNMINTQEVKSKYKLKWNTDITLNIDNLTWKCFFKQIFNNVKNNYLIWFQYNLIHRILGTKYTLCKMSIENTNICRICKCEPEILMHLFVNCSYVVNLWKSLELWILSCTNKIIIFTQNTIILGYLYNDNNYYPINTIIAVTKSYIFTSSVHECIPNINVLKNRLQKQFEDQYHFNVEINMVEKFMVNYGYNIRLVSIIFSSLTLMY